MKTLNNILTNDKTQTRRNAIQFAQENNYKVTEMYSEAKEARMKLMAAIHANGKEGNYSLATQYGVIVETLETWA